MAITFRSTKGSPLSHTELDNNFREFFHSASIDGSSVVFHKYTAISSSLSFPIDPPSGRDGYIQLKSGNDASGANATHTGSANLLFDYNSKILKVTGSTFFVGDTNTVGGVTVVGDTSTTGTVSITGSANITGDVIIDGNLRAEQFITTITTSSIVYQSGSTQFGDSSDDTHQFTGKLSVSNGITGSTDFNTLVNKPTLVSSSIQLASDISGSFTSLSASIASELDIRITTASSLNNVITFTKGDSSTFNVTVDTGSFTLTPTGSLITTASATGNVVTFTKGDSSTFDVTIITGSSVEVVLDSSPQLGGTLELNGNSISGSGTINISGSIATLGPITAGGDITAFYSSDERLKDNITPIEGAIEKINQIAGYEFDWNDNSEHSGHDVGVIAQEIEKVLPEIVVNRDNGYKAVRYEKIVALLIQAVKEQQSQIDELKSKL